MEDFKTNPLANDRYGDPEPSLSPMSSKYISTLRIKDSLDNPHNPNTDRKCQPSKGLFRNQSIRGSIETSDISETISYTRESLIKEKVHYLV